MPECKLGEFISHVGLLEERRLFVKALFQFIVPVSFNANSILKKSGYEIYFFLSKVTMLVSLIGCAMYALSCIATRSISNSEFVDCLKRGIYFIFLRITITVMQMCILQCY